MISGNVPSSLGVSGNLQASPLLSGGGTRPFRRSSNNGGFSPRPVSSVKSSTPRLFLNKKNDVSVQMSQIKGAAKLATISVTKLLNQNREPSQRELFQLWKLRVHVSSKKEHDYYGDEKAHFNCTQQLRGSLPQVQDYYLSQSSNNGNQSYRQSQYSQSMQQQMSNLNSLEMTEKNQIQYIPVQEIQNEICTIQKSSQNQEEANESMTLKQPDQQYDEEEQEHPELNQKNQNLANLDIPEHEMRADILPMLDTGRGFDFSESQKLSPSPQPATRKDNQTDLEKQQLLADKHKETIETTSDISSVNLDSDDSCFAATVEVIKLAPVKNSREKILCPSASHQEMPSTTNVSQADQQDQRQLRQSLDDLPSINNDALCGSNNTQAHNVVGNDDVTCFNQQINSERVTTSGLTQEEMIYQETLSPRQQNSHGVKRKAGKIMRPKFDTKALMLSEQSDRQNKAPNDATQLLKPPQSQQKISPQQQKTSKRKSLLLQDGSSDFTSRKKSMASQIYSGVDVSNIQASDFAKGPKILNRNSQIGQNINRSTNSSKQKSQSSERHAETPQFRRSLISNRQQSQSRISNEEVYYNLANKMTEIVRENSRPRKTNATKVVGRKTETPRHKVLLMQKLTKVAEAQIAAEVAMQEEKQKEKNRRLTKDIERKNDLLFQKKNLRGQASNPKQQSRPRPQQQLQQQKSQIIAKLTPVQMFSEKSKKAQATVKETRQKSLSKNLSQKGSFLSQEQIIPVSITPVSIAPASVSPFLQQNFAKNRSEITTPLRTRAGSKILFGQKNRAKVQSTRQNKKGDIKKPQVQKIDIQACLNNELRVKMPYGTIKNTIPILPQSARHSTAVNRNSLSNQFINPQRQQSKEKQRQHSRSNQQCKQQIQVRRSSSKSSNRTVSDRPMNSKYEPPVYKSRAFRNCYNDGLATNTDAQSSASQNMISHDQDHEQQLIQNDEILITQSYDHNQINQHNIELQVPQLSYMQQTQQQPLASLQTDNETEGQLQSDEPMNVVFAALAEQTHRNIRELIRFECKKDDEDGADQPEDEEVKQLQEQYNQQMKMAQVYEQANQVGLDVLKTVKKPIEVIEQETPAWTQNFGLHTEILPPKTNNGKKTPTDSAITLNEKRLHNIQSADFKIKKQSPQKMTIQDEALGSSKYNQAEDNFTLGKCSSDPNLNSSHNRDSISKPLMHSGQIQLPQDNLCRLTFGFEEVETAPEVEIQQKKERNIETKPNCMDSEENLSRIDAGLKRLQYALSPRIERYKVEFFIFLCEALNDSDEEGEAQEYDSEELEAQAILYQQLGVEHKSSSEDDVYGSSKYMGQNQKNKIDN